MRKRSKKEKELDTIKIVLLVVCVLIIIFTAVCLYVFSKTGYEPSTLITCFFATFSFELIACAFIKIFKLKFPDKKDKDNNTETEDIDYDDRTRQTR